MASIFSRIVAGEIPAHRVWEDDRHLAILDLAPVRPGHVLVIPKREVGYLFDLSADEQRALWDAVRRVEAGVRAATRCARTCLAVIGWEVPHVHVHLIPTTDGRDFPLPPRAKATDAALASTASSIRAALGTR